MKKNKNEGKIIKASFELQQKVGTGVIDETKLMKALLLPDSNKVDFEKLAKPQLDLLDKAIQRARQGVGNEKAILEGITLPLTTMKANASTLDYPLISKITGTVLSFLDHVGKIDDDILVIVENLHKAVMLIVMQKMTGRDSGSGNMLAQEFKDVCKRYLEKRREG